MTAIIGIKSTDDFFKDVEQKWTAIDRGEAVADPVSRIYFESAEALSKIITKQRHNLLQVLHINGGISIRGLAVLLGRNYKNVHQDVKLLEESGLIERDSKGHIIAPHEKLVIELPLAA
jgi:predicted transcriptional regulator